LSDKERVAVIGSGPMGLAVAYQLCLNGFKPIIFEADDRIGGMTASFDFNGLKIERYYHFHCTSDFDFLKIIDELGISQKMCWVETKMGYWYQNKLQPWGNPLALFTFRGLGLIAKVRYAFHIFFSTKRNNSQSLDRYEATAWIKKWVGDEAFDTLWKRLFELKFYNYSHNLSAAWIWSRIRRIGRSRYSLFKEKLGYLEGGTDTLLQALKESIVSKGGEFYLSSPVKEIIIQQNKVIGLDINNEFMSFTKVFSTTPLPYVPKLLPNISKDLLQKYKDVKNIAVVCVVVKLNKAVTETFWLNINDLEMDIPGMVEYSNLRPLDSHIIYIPFYMPGENAKFQESDNIFIEKVRRYIKKINTNISDQDFIDIHVSRYRYAQPICGPGFLNKLPPCKLPIEGLWVADTSYYYPEDRGISESVRFGRNMANDLSQ